MSIFAAVIDEYMLSFFIFILYKSLKIPEW